MERFFNTAGPCVPSQHYMLPPLDRLPTIRQLIDRGQYLVLHAPRQVGKTTALTALGRRRQEKESAFSAPARPIETGPAAGQVNLTAVIGGLVNSGIRFS